VHVSHSGLSKTFDFAPHSLFQTSFLAWYTDVVHEVKPITSGYRLVLSYNLIHTAPDIPRPTLPDMHTAVSNLRRVLRNWSKEAYHDDHTDMFAYLLQHQYSEVNLRATQLKGKDAHLIGHLRGIAEEFGVGLCLANLEYKMIGYGDDDGSNYYKRHRYNYCDEDDSDDTPSMMEVTDTELSVSNLVDLNGVPVLTGRDISLESECLIPKDPFEDISPDNKEYEGYMGNVSAISFN